jgi:hypothetical protein
MNVDFEWINSLKNEYLQKIMKNYELVVEFTL